MVLPQMVLPINSWIVTKNLSSNKANDVIEIFNQEKHNLILTDFKEDLTQHAINNIEEWQGENVWDNE